MLLKSRKSRKIFNHHHYLHSFWKSVRLQGIMNRWIKPRSNLFFPEHKMATSRVLHLVLVIIKTLFKSSFDLGKTATATITHTHAHTSMHARTRIPTCTFPNAFTRSHSEVHTHAHTNTNTQIQIKDSMKPHSEAIWSTFMVLLLSFSSKLCLIFAERYNLFAA